ncbi:MAG TPA: hypothetical protein VLF18_01650 [Tahibacter sp.]|uniref:hypothetical protein n=1 Tax=Tahibacter sp. TaxID=2056211 RepID=UPI002CB58C93|nr:hypothetical protein [Tahibacter sp.]HSX58879.1 hypothetical protein [Tahibacter sp.]
MASDLRRLEAALIAQGLPADRLRARVVDDETHNSIFPTAFTATLRWFGDSR